jgi:Insertion element 4 transposase N-terminal/Transposase DDE domain
MGYNLRQFETEGKFSHALTLDTLERAVPLATIKAVLQAEGVRAHRERKLNMVVIVLVTLAMNLYTHLSLRHVMQKLAQGLRFVWPDPTYPLPKASALAYRRAQLGVRPLVALFHRVCRPLATPATPGAFLFGLRLMAVDSTVEDLPDTPENVAVFGRYPGTRGPSAFPQVRAVYLAECGTHAIIDAGFWPGHTSERVGGFRILRSVTPEMLVMWDRGFHDYDMFVGVLQRGGQVLSRLPAHVKPKRVETLPDSSTLAYLYPSDPAQRKRGDHLVVRVVDYTLTDPALPGYGETHRIITTLLDPTVASALALVCAYHERWEIEILLDETDTHQRLAGRPLRSRTPLGVMQELFALVIAHYALRFVMHEAAVQSGIDPDRLSFVHALRVVQEAIPEFQMVAPDQWPQLYRRLLHDIADGLLPKRRHRSNPRVVKRKMSKFYLKRPEHYGWPRPTRPFCEAVAFI